MSSYELSGYGATGRGPGLRPAVLVVDFQRAFIDPAYPLGGFAGIEAAVTRTAKLLETARSAGVPVASCYTAYHTARDIPAWKIASVHELLFHGHRATELDPRIARADYDYIFCKTAPSIFFNTPLVSFLTKHQVDTVIVTGCTTSGCIRASVIDSFSWGYRTLVADECCGDVERGPHEANLRDIGRRYADVVSADLAEAYLRRIGTGRTTPPEAPDAG